MSRKNSLERPAGNAGLGAVNLGRVFFFLWLLAVCSRAYAGNTNIVEYTVQPYQDYVLERIVLGPDDVCWFAEFFNGIGRIGVTNGIATFNHYQDTTNVFGRPESIVLGPDNKLWFTEFNSNRVCRITTNGIISGWLLATNAHPTGITVGPDNNLWFLEYGLNKVAVMNTNGTLLAEYGPVATNSLLYNIITGPDGNLWFTESLAGKIGRITTGGSITEFPLPFTNCGPYDIAPGPDGAMWFTEFTSNKLGRIALTATPGDLSAISEFPMPLTTNQFTFYTNSPYGILLGPDSNIWYADKGAGFIGRFNPTNHILSYVFTPTTNSQPAFLTTGPDGNIWFSETLANFIGDLYITNLLTLNASNISTTVTNYPGIATYQNNNPTNTVTINWGDGTTNSITTTNFSGSTNGITIVTNAAGGGIINGSHAYASTNTHAVTIVVVDSRDAAAVANITISTGSASPPALTINSGAGGVITVSWPLSPPGFLLQSNGDLTTTNWLTLTNTPGNMFSVTNPPGDVFFRLINSN